MLPHVYSAQASANRPQAGNKQNRLIEFNCWPYMDQLQTMSGASLDMLILISD